MINRYPTVLTIAGSDSGGGAGIQADLKTIAALGAYGASAITAVTAQNTMEVRAIQSILPEILKQQLEAVFDDMVIDAVKIGMVNTVEVAEVISEALDKYRPPFVVFDPVMVSTSGSRLIRQETVGVLWETLFRKVDLITPNLDEAEILTGKIIDTKQGMKSAAEGMMVAGCRAVLLKGGHLAGPVLYDIFTQQGEQTFVFESEYIPSTNVHGTGCTLSSAIATMVALGHMLPDAILLSRQYVAKAISAGRHVKTGKGSGPLNHSVSPVAMQLKPL
jgi:hydroxymethylpyrimidine/phosphomethylpyrimidine kinase